MNFVIVLLVVTALLAGCNRPSSPPAVNTSREFCEMQASNARIDEVCAIELSKREIAARLNGKVFEKYQAEFDSANKTWTVTAYDDYGPPDSEKFVVVSLDGEIVDFRGGLSNPRVQ